MKNILSIGLLSLLLMSCAEDKYNEAHQAALTSKSPERNLGFGFRSGMSQEEAERHKAKVEAEDQLGFTSPSFGRMAMEDLTLGYLDGKLVEVEARLVSDSEVDHRELLDVLAIRYKSQRFPHNRVGDEAFSWFNGPIEIETYSHKLLGSHLSYHDVRYEADYNRQEVEAYNKKMKEDSAKTAAANQNL